MAQPIPLELPTHDARAELQTRLQNAPLQHAEALLSAYEVLQQLHDRGALDLLRGGLGSSDRVIEILVEAAKSPESIRGIRNLMVLAKIFAEIEPEVLEGLARSLPEAVALTKANPPSLLGILRIRSRNFRRGLVLMNSLLEAIGKNLHPKDPHHHKH